MKTYQKHLLLIAIAWALVGCSKAAIVNQTLTKDSALLAEAFDVAQDIEKDYSRAAALESIADLYLRENNYENARSVVSVIDEPQIRAFALARIATNAFEAGQSNIAGQLMDEAVQQVVTIKNAADRAYALAKLAEYDIGMGAQKAAQDRLNEAHGLALTLQDDHVKAYMLTKVAELMAKAGDTETSGAALTEAFAVTNAIENVGEQITAMDMISGVLAEDGQFEEAAAVGAVIKELRTRNAAPERIAGIFARLTEYDLAVTTAQTISKPYTKAFVLADVSAKARSNGHSEKADEILEAAAASVEQVADRTRRATALERISIEYLNAGAFEKALGVVATIPVSHIQAAALERVVSELGKSAQHDQAAKIAMQIGEAQPKYKAEALLAVANQHVVTDDRLRAVETLNEAFAVAQTDKNKYHQSVVLASLAGAYARAGQYQRAYDIAIAIEDDQQRSTALYRNVYWNLEADRMDDAIRIAGEIEEPYLKTMALTRAAEKSRMRLVGQNEG